MRAARYVKVDRHLSHGGVVAVFVKVSGHSHVCLSFSAGRMYLRPRWNFNGAALSLWGLGLCFCVAAINTASSNKFAQQNYPNIYEPLF